MSEPKEVIRRAMQNHRGDDFYRAKSAFRNCTPEQMLEQYGQSGKTRQQILDEYARIDAEWVEANALLERLLAQ